MADLLQAKMAKRAFLAFLAGAIIVGCVDQNTPNSAGEQSLNPVRYFEIPVTDMERAIDFYSALFGYEFERVTIDGYDMALFPADDGGGATGALAQGDVYVPSHTGVIVYFSVPDIDPVLERAVQRGARVLYAKKAIGEAGFVAEIEDSEGNRIALHAAQD